MASVSEALNYLIFFHFSSLKFKLSHVATMLDSTALAHHSADFSSGEHVQTGKLNRHTGLDIPVSSHSPLFCQLINTVSPWGVPYLVTCEQEAGRAYPPASRSIEIKRASFLGTFCGAMRNWFESKMWSWPLRTRSLSSQYRERR